MELIDSNTSWARIILDTLKHIISNAYAVHRERFTLTKTKKASK